MRKSEWFGDQSSHHGAYQKHLSELVWFANIHQNQRSSTKFKRGERGGVKESTRLQEKRQEQGGRWEISVAAQGLWD